MAELLNAWQRACLQEFLRMKAAQPHVWGKTDCGLMLADWLMMAKGMPDPVADLRATYRDAEGAGEVVGDGGFLAFVDKIATACACPVTETPGDGDIAVIDIPMVGNTGAIMTKESWAFKSPKGLVWARVSPGRVLRAWSVF